MDFSLLCCMATIPDSLALVTFTRFPSYWNAIVKASIPSIGYLMGFWSCCARRRMLCWRQNLLILLGVDWPGSYFQSLLPKKGLLREPSLKVNNLVFHQTPQQEDCNNSQNLHNHQLLIHFFSLFKITSSGVAYFSWKKNSFMLSFDMQGNMNFQFSQWYEILNFLDQIKNTSTTSILKIILFSYILFSWIKKWNYYLVKVY